MPSSTGTSPMQTVTAMNLDFHQDFLLVPLEMNYYLQELNCKNVVSYVLGLVEIIEYGEPYDLLTINSPVSESTDIALMASGHRRQ